MDKETFSSYGWLIVTVIVVAIMVAFATPFGQYITQSVSNLLNKFATAADAKITAAATAGGFTPATGGTFSL